MKSIALITSVLLFVEIGLAQERTPTVETLTESLQKKTQTLNAKYLVFAPKEKPKTAPPLVIYLHGAGGKGDDLQKVRNQTLALVRGIQKFAKTPSIVVAPQCCAKPTKGAGWIPEDLDLLLSHLKATLEIDEARIYLTGNSMGGYGAWAWGGHSPQHFAAIAPISGGLGRGGPKDVTKNLDAWAANLAKVPVYAFVGEKDRVVPAERSKRMIEAIRKTGGKHAKIKIYPDERHNARRLVYSTAEYYEWMFANKNKSKNGPKSKK